MIDFFLHLLCASNLAYGDELVGSTHEQRSVSVEIGTHTLKLRDGTVTQVLVNAGFTFAEMSE
jgi:hypothetical protein